jgi:hypothetical protein
MFSGRSCPGRKKNSNELFRDNEKDIRGYRAPSMRYPEFPEDCNDEGGISL